MEEGKKNKETGKKNWRRGSKKMEMGKKKMEKGKRLQMSSYDPLCYNIFRSISWRPIFRVKGYKCPLFNI